MISGEKIQVLNLSQEDIAQIFSIRFEGNGDNVSEKPVSNRNHGHGYEH